MATTIDVKDLAGKKVGTVDLPASLVRGEVNVPVMHQVVTAQLAAARQGTHKTKTRGEVARRWPQAVAPEGHRPRPAGLDPLPQWVGGGVAHGRVPKDWSVRVNKKVKRAALRSALTDRANSERVTVVRDLAFDAPRTKDAVAALAALGLEGKVLVVLADWDEATVQVLPQPARRPHARRRPAQHPRRARQRRRRVRRGALELIGTGVARGAATADPEEVAA
jgi:large subunit ribosomal protein L4